jgi:hypothetical protein
MANVKIFVHDINLDNSTSRIRGVEVMEKDINAWIWDTIPNVKSVTITQTSTAYTDKHGFTKMVIATTIAYAT